MNRNKKGASIITIMLGKSKGAKNANISGYRLVLACTNLAKTGRRFQNNSYKKTERDGLNYANN
jgi:hypothetical protein